MNGIAKQTLNFDGLTSQANVFPTLSVCTDYATSSDSEVETPQVDQSWRGDGDSDAESIDSEQEDVLKLVF